MDVPRTASNGFPYAPSIDEAGQEAAADDDDDWIGWHSIPLIDRMDVELYSDTGKTRIKSLAGTTSSSRLLRLADSQYRWMLARVKEFSI